MFLITDFSNAKNGNIILDIMLLPVKRRFEGVNFAKGRFVTNLFTLYIKLI